MKLKLPIEKLIDKVDLHFDEMQDAMQCLLRGEANDIEIAAFLIALQSKGETTTELIAAVEVMQAHVLPLQIHGQDFLDIVGTGGDGLQTFNISTASSFVVAAAGGKIAKHGNRSVSSKCGAADLLEIAGVNLNTPFDKIAETIDALGIGFMFAPQHHQAIRHVMPVRKKLGVRTIFNLLGPLTNPARASHHLIGVFAKHWLEPFAQVLQYFKAKKALIIHGEDGLDEITLDGETYVVELRDNKISSYTIHPEQFGISQQKLTPIQVSNSTESLQLIQKVFAAEKGPAFDIVCLNAGAALYAADLSESIKDGVLYSHELLESGKVAHVFNHYVKAVG